MSGPFSTRVAHAPDENRLTATIRRIRAAGQKIVDLTVSNPTAVGVEYPLNDIADALARGAHRRYEPDPLGLLSARTTIATRLGCSPDDIVITASTSEAYSFLFKLLADPGDEILTARPAYPLLDQLALIESCTLRQFPLSYEPGHGWSIDPSAARECLTNATRTLVVVHPNNPTGSFVSPNEAHSLGELCGEKGIALISDEVFLAYPLETSTAPASLGDLDLPCLTFTLGGLSKQAGLPHLKLGWIRVSGPETLRRQAVAGLELIADNFLSVATPVQAAIADILTIGETIRERIAARTRANLDALRAIVASHPHVECLPVQGGWSAVIRVPALMPDEDLVIRVLEETGVLVHPGHFFDFERDGFLVVSLLAEQLDDPLQRVLASIGS